MSLRRSATGRTVTDPAVVIATAAVVIALLACVMASNATRHSVLVSQQFKRLHKKFWERSIEQSNDNVKNWSAHESHAQEHLKLIQALRVTLGNDKLFETPRRTHNKPN